MINTKKRWIPYDKNYNKISDFTRELGLSELVSRVMINRDIDTVEKAKRFMAGNIENLYDPYLLKDMDIAIDRIMEAIEEQQKICIFGDYDVDGVTSTTIVVKLLEQLESNVIYYIPNRMEEGYGLNNEAINFLADQSVNLIITVDCGIRSADVVEYANNIGIDMIITDHHECGDELPNACAVINPHRPDCNYPFKELAGVGVAFKLMDALVTELGCREFIYDIIDIVAIGTIADIVNLQDENRIIVKYGLTMLKNTNNIGIKALLDVCGINDQTVNTFNIAFMIAPRINAAGRIANASLCVELLLTDDYKRAYEISRQLDSDNKERQSIEAQILSSAVAKIEKNPDFQKDKIIVLDDENWHIGVIGIVASKLVEKYNLPTILITKDDKIGKGSARSVSNFNIYEALEKCSDLFIKFGGHELAAGITIEVGKIEALREKINQIAEEMLCGEPLIPEILVDYRLTSGDINLNTVKQLNTLEPFGAGNPVPLFVCRGLKVMSCKTVGNDNKHLLLTLNDGKSEFRGIGFNMGCYNNILSFGKIIDIICSVDCNVWNNVEQVQLKIKDIKLSKN